MADTTVDTLVQNLTPADRDLLYSLQNKKVALEKKLNDPNISNADFKKLRNEIEVLQKNIDDILVKGRTQGDPLLNQKGVNSGEPTPTQGLTKSENAMIKRVSGDGSQEGIGESTLGDRIRTASAKAGLAEDEITPRTQIEIGGAPLPNVLHQYPSYTYSLSLHLLTNEEYNTIVTSNGKEYTPKRVLIASAGRHDAYTFPRAPNFSKDYYFENLELETVIGLNAASRNTNAVKASFTIVEPYGLTLMENLMDATAAIGGYSYLDNPYLLEIDFFAQNDAGEIVGKLTNITKRIPIKIASMSIKAGVKGAEYAIQAFAFNHTAFDTTTVTGPDHIEVVAGTISEFFGIDPVTAKPVAENTKIREVKNSPFGTKETIAPVPSILQASNNDKSYAGALNSFYADLKNKNLIREYDSYSFELDPEIAKGQTFKAISKSIVANSANKMADTSKTFSIRLANIPEASGQSTTADFDKTKKIFSINAGTTVEKVINYVIRMSDYIQKQLAVPEDYGDNPSGYKAKLDQIKNEHLSWFKIIPTIKLGEWDNRRKVWRRHITYHIVPYVVKNVKMDTAPQATETKPVKKYEYIYTGKNVDIIDWDLQFNALYYNAMTVYKNALTTINNLRDNRLDEESKNFATTEYKGIDTAYNGIMPIPNKPIILNTQAVAGSGAITAREVAVADLDESLMTMSGADMLQVNLKIIGDPAYIKQDDVFYPPTAFNDQKEPDPGVDRRLTPNNSLRTDYGEVYVQLIFSTPKDIDESTGLMEFNSKKQTSVFSGLYKVLTVTSTFSQGAFTQVLNLIRLPRQTAFDYTAVKSEQTVERVDNKTSIENNVTNADAKTVISSTAEPEDGVKVTDTLAENETLVDAEQKNLANVAATAETQTITAATEPAPVPPPPPPKPPLPDGVTIDPVSGNYVYKGVTFGGDLNAGVQAIDTKATVTYNAVDPVSGTVVSRTVDGAALVEAYSPTGQARSEYESKLADVQRIERNLAKDPTTYGTAAEGQQILEIRKANLAKAKAAYDATLK